MSLTGFIYNANEHNTQTSSVRFTSRLYSLELLRCWTIASGTKCLKSLRAHNNPPRPTNLSGTFCPASLKVSDFLVPILEIDLILHAEIKVVLHSSKSRVAPTDTHTHTNDKPTTALGNYRGRGEPRQSTGHSSHYSCMPPGWFPLACWGASHTLLLHGTHTNKNKQNLAK